MSLFLTALSKFQFVSISRRAGPKVGSDTVNRIINDAVSLNEKILDPIGANERKRYRRTPLTPLYQIQFPLSPEDVRLGFFKVTMIKSLIGLPQKTKNLAGFIGFERRFQPRYLHINKATVGAITRLKEILKVERIKAEELPQDGIYRHHRHDPGFRVIGSILSNENLLIE